MSRNELYDRRVSDLPRLIKANHSRQSSRFCPFVLITNSFSVHKKRNSSFFSSFASRWQKLFNKTPRQLQQQQWATFAAAGSNLTSWLPRLLNPISRPEEPTATYTWPRGINHQEGQQGGGSGSCSAWATTFIAHKNGMLKKQSKKNEGNSRSPLRCVCRIIFNNKTKKKK